MTAGNTYCLQWLNTPHKSYMLLCTAQLPIMPWGPKEQHTSCAVGTEQMKVTDEMKMQKWRKYFEQKRVKSLGDSS